MELEEIKEFLKSRPGYLKEGGKRLRDHLSRKGFDSTIRKCKQALQEVRAELKIKPTFKNIENTKILFYDIEVSYGLARAWRPSYKTSISYSDFKIHPKIICISWKWNNSDEVNTVRWDKNHDDKELLKLFISELNKADFIVGHNGDRFDLPWIKTRALKHRLDIYPSYSSVDTLKIARYNHNFPSNRLDDIGDYLGLGRKIKTDMSLWDDVFEGDIKALDKMIEYCEQDVILLEKIYNELSKTTLAPIHNGVLNNEIKQTSPYTGSINIELIKTTTTASGTKRHLMKCLDTNKYFKMSNADYKKFKLINE
jgi:uncharacterized protein YprB with RNaseH-like and TPR domain